MNLNSSGVLRSLGGTKDPSLIISSISLVVNIFFYFFVLGDAVQTRIYAFIHGVTYESQFTANIINTSTDIFILLLSSSIWIYLSVNNRYIKGTATAFFILAIIVQYLNIGTISVVAAASSLPFVTVLIFIDRFVQKGLLKFDSTLSLNYICLGVILLALSGITALIVNLTTGIATFTIDKYSYSIFQLLYSTVTPLLMAVLVFCLPLKAILNECLNRLKVRRHSIRTESGSKIDNKKIAIYLFLSVLFSISLTVIPHLQAVNPNNQRLGVDTAGYVNLLGKMKIDPIVMAFTKVSHGDRPLTMMFLFIVTEFTKASPYQVLEYIPSALGPVLVIMMFVLTREMTKNDKISIISSFMTAVSFQTLVGIYSGFYANWLALIIGYAALVMLIKYLKSSSKFKLIALALLLIGVLLTHVYTWTIITLVAFVLLITLYSLNYYPRKRIIILCLILLSSVGVDLLKAGLTSSATGLEADVSLSFKYGFGASQFSERFNSLTATVQTYYGGAYANIAILGLCLYWLVRCNSRELVNIFVLIFLSSALIPLLIGDWVLQSRVLYEIPFQIPAAISLSVIWNEKQKLAFVALLLVLVYLSLHIVANFGYLPPPSP